MTFGRSMGLPSLFPISLFVGWKSTSTRGCESALIARSVSFSGLCLYAWWIEAPTMSKFSKKALS